MSEYNYPQFNFADQSGPEGGGYQSMFGGQTANVDFSGYGTPTSSTPWGSIIGAATHAIGGMFKEMDKEKPTNFVAPGRVNYNPQDIPVSRSRDIPSPTAPGLARFSNISDVERRLKASVRDTSAEPIYSHDYTKNSIGGRLQKSDALKAFQLGQKYGGQKYSG